jgi:GT2 family glycosyltransferase/glycosyltransferase involved in cell wall biosynthesis
MPPTALPVRETLKLPGQTTTAWAVFDAARYLAAYPDVRTEIGPASDATILAFYLDRGQKRGHSPNIYFDEAWYLNNYPGAAAAVREGHAQSGFDTYCRAGLWLRSPHWLFNETQYRQRHPDLRDDVLLAVGNANGYDHYLKHGNREGRIGHMLFDPAVYRAQLDQSEMAEADVLGTFLHYLRRIATGMPEIRTSQYFDPARYLQRYQAVVEAIAAGEWLCALHHYLCNNKPTTFDPLPEFSETHYLALYEDIAAAVEAKDLRSGYFHFLNHGARELRSPTASIDLKYYATTHPSVRTDLEHGRARDAFVHYLSIGRQLGLQPMPEAQITERQASNLYRRKADDLLPINSRAVFDFACTEAPALSVIMLLHDRFPLTLMTLGSLRANYRGDIELILVDAGSTDETRQIHRFARGAEVLRFDFDIDFVRGCNAALQCATADSVLFLDNAVELTPGALGAAVRRLHSDAHIGAVGGKVIRAHGRLQDAGSIIWRDGTTLGYLSDSSPLAPEANFVRDVDFCSAMFLLVRGALLRQLEGFDDAFAANGYAEADLCMRVAEAGYRVVYDPTVAINRYAQGGPGDKSDAGEPGSAQQLFFGKHNNQLRFRHIAAERAELFARSTDPGMRVLFIEDMIPLRQLGSGFVRSNDLIQVMASLGVRVTVFPINPCRFSLAIIYGAVPDTVEVMHDRTGEDLAEFLIARRGYYDAIWIARTHNLDRVKQMIEHMTLGTDRPPRIVLDTEAISTMREAERAALSHQAPFDVDAAIMQEFANAHFCQSIIAVSSEEARKLRDLGFSDVAVIGHLREARPTPRTFAERSGMLFLGAMHDRDSPNYDALGWFVREVLPLVEEALGWETQLTVVGYTGEQVSLEQYNGHPRITLLGMVDDTEPLYNAHRIFVAPTRYAAGIPYKVHESASFGLPVVATELLRRQLGWQNDRDLLAVDAGDPAEFAHRIVTLYRDANLWQELRGCALERVGVENNRERYDEAVRLALQPRTHPIPGARPDVVSYPQGDDR